MPARLVGWMYIRSFYFIKYSHLPSRSREKVGLMWATTAGRPDHGHLIGIAYPYTAAEGIITGGVLSGGYGWLEGLPSWARFRPWA